MSFESNASPCPCESGRQFNQCCGNDANSEINFIFDLANNVNDNPLSDELKSAVADINREPSLFPVTVDFIDDTVELVKMSPYWFSESVFLDRERIQGRCGLKANVNWLVENVDKTHWQTLPFIFHSAFCGSTLMVNALELLFNTLPLREPDVLGGLLNYHLSENYNAKQEMEYQYIVMSLLSRRFENQQVPVYKSNDIHNAYISTLLDWPAEIPVLIMYTGLKDFVVSCIKKEIRKDWISDRYKYCHRYFEYRFNLAGNDSSKEYSFAEKAAAYWSFNMLLFHESINKSPSHVRTLNFSDMLKDPMGCINDCGEWFGLEKREGINPKYELNWLMGQHAKNVTQEYSPAQRQAEMKPVFDSSVDELLAAEALARKILGDKFPDDGLPNKL